MIVDVSSLFNGTQEEIKLDISEKLDEIDFSGEIINYKEPVTFKGRLFKDGKFAILTGKLHAEIVTQCARCLEDVHNEMDIAIREKYGNIAHLNQDEDYFLMENQEIDLNLVFKDNIIANLQIRYLCKDDCKGLCPICGINLNSGSCECKDDYINPEFLKIKKLLENREV